jgi:glycosyltransferase involved in cell wall biosynthesis
LPRILGVLIARNEWPLLGISITHAMVNHVDKLIVVDHASTDQTQAGLAALQKRWGNKIQVLHLCEGTFHHEDTNLMLKSIYEGRDFDWVYPIDADEFLITQDNLSLKQILAQVPANYEAVRYELHNFVSPTDFVEQDFERYSELREKAVVNPDFKLTHGDFVESVIQGGLNFFDVPFDSKVIFRLPQDSWAAAGSHSMLGIGKEAEHKLPPVDTFVAHLPFLTRERLERRADQGRAMVKSGYPKNHGWQSQVVHQMQVDGRLDEYWKKNSINKTSSDSVFSPPKTITENRLAPVLEAAISELLRSLNDMENVFSIQQSACEPSVTLSEGVHAVHAMARFKQENIDSAHLHIGELNQHIQDLQLQLQAQADHYSAERTEFLSSISWRATRGLRLVGKLISCLL